MSNERYISQRYKSSNFNANLDITCATVGTGVTGQGFGIGHTGSAANLAGKYAPWHVLRLYRYKLDFATSNGGATPLVAHPMLGWCTVAAGSGTMVVPIETDICVIQAGVSAEFHFDHDYGPDGKTIFQPANGLECFLGLINAAGTLLSNNSWIYLEYGLDVDYRKLPFPIREVGHVG